MTISNIFNRNSSIELKNEKTSIKLSFKGVPDVPLSELSPEEVTALRKFCREIYAKLKVAKDAGSPSADRFDKYPYQGNIQEDISLYRELKAYLKGIILEG